MRILPSKTIYLAIFFLINVLLINNSLYSQTPYTMYVDDNGNDANTPYTDSGNPAATIQAAIDYIPTLVGDTDLTATGADAIVTIIVFAGTYDESGGTSIDVTGVSADAAHYITIQGSPSKAATIQNTTINLTADYTVLDGLVIDGGSDDFNANLFRGISFDGMHCTVKNCDIQNVTQDANNDAALGISGSADYTKIVNCRILNSDMGARVRSDYVVFRSNIFGGNLGRAINFGTTGHYGEASYNLFYGNGPAVAVNTVMDVLIYNNIMCDGNSVGVYIISGGDVENTKIFNNTIIGNGNGIEIGSPNNADDISIYNNIIYKNTGTGILGDGDNGTYALMDYNCVISNGIDYTVNLATPRPNDTNADPKLISLSSGSADVGKLNSGSPVIDQGLDDDSGTGMVYDYHGGPRKWDDTGVVDSPSILDIGAVEYAVIGPTPNLLITKQVYSTTLKGSATTPKPGTSLTYKLTYHNTGTDSANDVLFRDYISAGVAYKSNSLKVGEYNDSYDAALSDSDAGGNNSGFASYDLGLNAVFFTPKNNDCPDPAGHNIAIDESGTMYFQVVISNKPIGTSINNSFTSTGANFSVGTAGPVLTTVADLYGGRLSFADDRTNFLGNTTIWTMWITNKGNLATTFSFSENVINTFNSAPADWTIVFSDADSGVLAIGASFQFTVSVTPDAGVPSGAWIDFDIIADTGNTTETNYIGDDNLPYGGDIGETNNGTIASSLYGKIVQQGNTLNGPAVRLWRIINNSTLSIEKSVNEITLDGSPIAAPIPGAQVTYSIWYSNQGPGPATDAIINDQLSTDVIYFEMPVYSGWTNETTTANPPDQSWGSGDYSPAPVGPSADSTIKWIRWKNSFIASDETGVLNFKVIVK